MKVSFVLLALGTIVAARTALDAEAKAKAKFVEHYVEHARKQRGIDTNVCGEIASE